MQTKQYKSLGIDPGYSGAAVYIETNDITRCKHMQIIEFKDYLYKEKKQKTKKVHYQKLINDLDICMCAEVITLENVKAMPRDGGTSAFNFGYFTGVLRTICEANNFYEPTRWEILNPRPQEWKSSIGLKTGATKQDSVDLAVDFFPDFKDNFYGPRGGIKDGVAEAALLAVYGIEYLYDNGENE